MTLGDAIARAFCESLTVNAWIRRPSWPVAMRAIVYEVREPTSAFRAVPNGARFAFTLHCDGTCYVGWCPSADDMAADDWRPDPAVPNSPAGQ